MTRKLVAETLGTGLLVLIGVGVATLSFGFGATGSSASAGVVATALAFGLVLLVLVYAIGPISGCHINPAVTLGAFLARRMSLREAGGYWVAQFAGAIAGALLLWAIFNGSPLYHRSLTGLGTNGWGKQSLVHISMGGAFLAEVVLTAVFVLAVLSATRGDQPRAAVGVVIGLALATVHLIGIPLTGTSVNPARSLGPALVVGGAALRQVWLFIVAPLVGAVLAAIVHETLNPPTAERVVDLPEQPTAAEAELRLGSTEEPTATT